MGFPKQYGSSARKGGRRSWETTGRMSLPSSCGSGTAGREERLRERSETYLTKEGTLKPEQDFHYQFHAQASSLSRRIYKEHGVGLQELQVLKSIYLLYMGKERAVSKINQEQELLLEKTGVEFSLC